MLIFVSKIQSFIIGYLRFYLTGGILFNYFSGLFFNYIIHSGENSAQYWQKNVRLCRPMTDQELGYKLWIDETNDQIVVTTLAQAQPANTRELEKGLLRGLAVRWMNEEKTNVLAPLSKLQAEVDKTKNGGEYEWFGFFE